MAALLVAAVGAGLITVNTEDTDASRAALVWHQSLGLVVFVFTVARVAWRLTHPAPPLPPEMPRGQQIAALINHVTLYLLLVLIPLAGYAGLAARGRVISVFGLFDLPQIEYRDFGVARTANELHALSQYALYAVVAAHVLAALYHQFVLRDGLMRRMWFK
jgi:cytochrome b561